MGQGGAALGGAGFQRGDLPQPSRCALRLFGESVMTAIERWSVATWPTPRPLRVTMLGLRGFPNVQGGVENHAQNLSLRLVELGCDVEVIVRSPYVPRASSRTWC